MIPTIPMRIVAQLPLGDNHVQYGSAPNMPSVHQVSTYGGHDMLCEEKGIMRVQNLINRSSSTSTYIVADRRFLSLPSHSSNDTYNTSTHQLPW